MPEFIPEHTPVGLDDFTEGLYDRGRMAAPQ